MFNVSGVWYTLNKYNILVYDLISSFNVSASFYQRFKAGANTSISTLCSICDMLNGILRSRGIEERVDLKDVAAYVPNVELILHYKKELLENNGEKLKMVFSREKNKKAIQDIRGKSTDTDQIKNYDKRPFWNVINEYNISMYGIINVFGLNSSLCQRFKLDNNISLKTICSILDIINAILEASEIDRKITLDDVVKYVPKEKTIDEYSNIYSKKQANNAQRELKKSAKYEPKKIDLEGKIIIY